MREHEIKSESYTLGWIEEIAEQAEKYGVGNCCEKACVAFSFLYKKIRAQAPDKQCSIELFNNPFWDHFFVVLNRSPDTESADPRTWNKDAVICDPWAIGKSYQMDSVDFSNIHKKTAKITQFLKPKNVTAGPVVLQQDVLASANNISNVLIISQDVIVLRNRIDISKKEFSVHNAEVPIAYEKWDFPTKKDYSRQRKLHQREDKSDDEMDHKSRLDSKSPR
jgi:hypothetical protein